MLLPAAVQNFLGGMDEEWFRLVHVAIEAAAAPAIAALQPLQQAAQQVRAPYGIHACFVRDVLTGYYCLYVQQFGLTCLLF
jgi:hypothetical protein